MSICTMSSQVTDVISFFFQTLIIYPYVSGNEIVKCQTDETSWIDRSREFCNKPKDLSYHCLPTLFLNESVEHCLTVQTIQAGISIHIYTARCCLRLYIK